MYFLLIQYNAVSLPSEVRFDNGSIEQVNDYTPFGVLMKNTFTAISTQPYKYNGKELDRMHGLDLYDYGARLYDASLGRWHTLDPLCEKYYSVSPYVYCANNPVKFVDPDGNSPFSVLLKHVAKSGIKAGVQAFIKNNVQRRLQNYMSKEMLHQFTKDATDIVNLLDNTWWKTALEMVPIIGDICSCKSLVKKARIVFDKVQDLENKYVGRIYESLSDEGKKRFKRNMRRAGVEDARKDQAAGVGFSQGVNYKKGSGIDGHHNTPVSEDPSKMTDPRNITFMSQKEHQKLHQKK